MSTIVLSRRDNSTPWGFRMQGGKDFSAPLTVARVTPGTIAANAGLQTGDVIATVNGHDVSNLKHKDAQDVIIGAGNNITFVLKRVSSGVSGPSTSPVTSNRVGAGDHADGSLLTSVQSLSISGPKPTHSVRYDDAVPGAVGTTPAYSGYINPDNQSQSFKALQTGVDSGKTPAAGTATPWQRQTVNEQSHEPKKYTPSATWQMLQEESAPSKVEGSGGSSGHVQAQATAAPFKPGPQMHVHAAASNPSELRISAGAPLPPPPPPSSSAPAAKSVVAPPPPPAWSAAAMKNAATPAPPTPSGAARGWQPPSRSGADSGDGAAIRGSSVFSQPNADGSKIPVCDSCHQSIRGPFAVALGKTWCPNHFTCAQCKEQLINIGFVELNGAVYCERDYEAFFAPNCFKCNKAIVGETVNALNKSWHPKCFVCTVCNQPIKSGSFHVEDGKPYCTKDWSQLFQVKCKGCQFPVEPGDKWVEALGDNYHATCFNCSVCNVNLEGKPFFPKNGKAFCKAHAK